MSTAVSSLTIAGWPVTDQVVEEPPLSEDAELVVRARSGNEEAFRRLVEKYRPVAYRTAYGFVRDEHTARDISQEAFVRVYRSLDRFDTSRPFATWLRRITVNLAVDELRRRRRRPEAPLDVDVAARPQADPSREAELAEEKQAVWEVLDQLPLKYRTVMVLREIEELPTEEVARIVGCPPVSVRWRLHRARKLFRERWLAHYDEG